MSKPRYRRKKNPNPDKEALPSFQINRDWHSISGHPVVLNKYTQMGKSATARAMERAAAATRKV
jgi:hypothetical protein